MRDEPDDRLSLLLELGGRLSRESHFDALLGDVGRRVARAMQAERATVFVLDAASGELRSHLADMPEQIEIRLRVGQGIAGEVARSGRAIRVDDPSRDPRWYPEVDRATGFVTRSLLAVPMRDARRKIRGVLQVINKRRGVFDDDDEAYLATMAGQLALALEWTTLRPDGAPRGLCVRGPYNHIVGSGPHMQRVYDLLDRAAKTDATVLLLGETGTGKSLVARAVHANSRRAERPFVTVDATTLPEALVENELFGHERGAFTGADKRVAGKVEQASTGTLFLDEIGELSLPAQAKLLRLLQDRVVERLGGSEPVSVDVRFVAATHKDLAREVRHKRFRQDLYYRTRVIEIRLPALRERGSDDVLGLARHFLSLALRRYDRPGTTLSKDAEARLVEHAWPGNVRELEHAIERGVVLSDGEIAPRHLGLGDGEPPPSEAPEAGVVLPRGLSLDEATRRYAEATLREVSGNASETARRLRIGRNTLARLVKG